MLRSSLRYTLRKEVVSPISRIRPTIAIFHPISSHRYYASTQKKPDPKDSSKKSEEPPKQRSKHFYPLLGLGILALGVSYYNLNTSTKIPKASIDPVPSKEGSTKQLFEENEIDVIFVLGGPGSGKGTQCAKLVSDYKFVHLSAGDLLRAEQNKPGSEVGELIKNYIKEGQIVPQEITIGLLKDAIVENWEKGKTKFLIDGFPRKMDQAISFEQLIVNSKVVLYFECSEKIMLNRLLERGKTSGRIDDNVESIMKRFKVFKDTSYPVIEFYNEKGRVITVSCDQPVDTVYSTVVDDFKKRGIVS